MNSDCFPGQDAGVCRGGVEDAKNQCREHGLGGFVEWRGISYLRRQDGAELCAAKQFAPGSNLWISASRLVEKAPSGFDFALPLSLPEVVVTGSRPVEKCEGLSEEAMTARCIASRPVVLKDAQAGWPAREKWTFEWLAAQYGEEAMICSDLAPFFGAVDRHNIQTVTAPMHEVVRYILGKPNALRLMQTGTEKVFYANGWSPFERHRNLLEDVSDRLYCVRDTVPPGKFNDTLTKVFFGPAGTISRLHHDTYASHVWLSQIRGRKQFICYPPGDSKYLYGKEDDSGIEGEISLFKPDDPDYDTFPNARQASPYSVIVEEGETVCLPRNWWHWAKSLTPSITLMRNYVNEVNFDEHMRIVRKCTAAKQQKGIRS